MRSLNSLPSLNAFELKVVESAPVTAKHILLVGAGDGRLADALRAKVGGASVSVVEPQASLRGYLAEFGDVGSDPWDLAWYQRQAARGPFDFIVFQGLHAFWQGQVATYKAILDLAVPGAIVWTGFLNSFARRTQQAFAPSRNLSVASLASPFNLAARIDYASWMAYVAALGGTVTRLWGLLDPDALEYCQKATQPRPPDYKAPVWEFNGQKLTIQTIADAFLWGATYVATEVRVGLVNTAQPEISGSPFHPALLQSLVVPFPEAQADELDRMQSAAAARAYLANPQLPPNNLLQFFLRQTEEFEGVRSVLVIGAGWGRDLLQIRAQKPDWTIVGVDPVRHRVEAGAAVVAKEGLQLQAVAAGEPLPFGNESFDLVLTLGYLSIVHQPLAETLLKEAIRIARVAVLHLEDARGPAVSLDLKPHQLQAIYGALGYETQALPVNVNQQASGMYILKYVK